MWLLSRWIARALAAPEFFESYEAVGLIATGVTLYALYMVLVVILGRTGRTEFNFPATAAALVANVALNLAAGAAAGDRRRRPRPGRLLRRRLALMYVFTQRLFPVPYEWGRLARVVLVSAALVGLRRAAAADRRRSPACSAGSRSGSPFPLALLASGFFTPRSAAGSPLLRHPGELIAPASGAATRSARPRSTARSPRPTRPRPLDEDTLRLEAVGAVADALAACREAAPGGRGPSRRGRGGGQDERGEGPQRRRTRR